MALKPTLLIVDDDPLIGESLSFVLSDEFDVRVRESRTEAMALVKSGAFQPQLALIDLGLPPLPHLPTEGFKLLGDLLAWSQRTMEVDVEGHQEKQLVKFVSGNYFPMLGVQARFGRTFTEEDDGPGPSNLAIIGYRSWEKYFGRSPDVLNKSIKVQKLNP